MKIFASDKQEQHVKTTCCYCGVGCGVEATLFNNQLVGVAGDLAHPANHGKLCIKGSTLDKTKALTNRLQTPLIQGKPAEWGAALDLATSQFQRIINEYGPESVGFYLSGQLLTEDYYVANKLMKGFIGSANVDTNSRLCMSSAVAAHKRAFGEDIVAGSYSDLESTDVLLLVGSNMAYTHPIVYQRIVAAKKARKDMQIIVIDPRKTPTCDIADIHLPLRPGSDAFFFNGLLAYIAANNGLDCGFIRYHSNNFEAALQAARQQVGTVSEAAHYCGIDESLLERVYRLFLTQEKAVTVFSQGINQSSSGVDKGNAIINCHLASGKIGKPGCAPFSITGQPNAMGGREVGGLSNQLAAHLGFTPEDIDCVETFWNAPNMARSEGLKAVDMFDALADGRLKAIWIMATNPAVSMPNANKVRKALQSCELVIVSECVANTDTAQLADIVFPTTTWGEKSGTVTNSERCISLQKGFLPAPGKALNDWQIITRFAHKLGFESAFNYNHVADIFREHAALSGFNNNATRAFDISEYATINNEDYDNLSPFYWPLNNKPVFADYHFYTSNNKASFIPIEAKLPDKHIALGQLILNTGRIRDQWHTMSRTGASSKLVNHTDEPFIDLNPTDAERLNLKDNDLAVISNDLAEYHGRVRLSQGMNIGEVFIPIHWNDRFASNACASALVKPITDPISGQPEFKHTPVNIKALQPKWEALILAKVDIKPNSDYWVKIPIETGFKYRLAGKQIQENWRGWLRSQFESIEEWSEFTDTDSQFYRATGFINGQLAVTAFINMNQSAMAEENNWLESQLGEVCNSSDRYAVLAGHSADGSGEKDNIICSCFEVGEKCITQAIARGCNSSEKLGNQLKCGTNCGSCVPELNALIEQAEKVHVG